MKQTTRDFYLFFSRTNEKQVALSRSTVDEIPQAVKRKNKKIQQKDLHYE